ncbi:EGF-like repeat and discoidin I-like domain-containing protein 3 [Dendronephthya gigantea]|uniref:EGF-like repeat and discoidin I-like domain-containing protein 3 n=1 Tax=Dendronephthya gigantea TaxID=151771 RepID=UPI00106DCE95|nr:EGF-like repeat and discoidin I-like domain-containing protein 3 [Dendronephthya gigantea]
MKNILTIRMFLQSSMFLQLQFVFLTASQYLAIRHGSSLRNNVIAEFTEEMDLFCELRCAENRFCVAFSYKEKTLENELNCQLTNTTEHKFNERHETREEQVWTFHEAKVDRSQFASCRGEVNECHNGGKMTWEIGRQFSCWCLKCYEGERCKNVRTEALGMEDGSILDSQITASSNFDINHREANGRLNFIPHSGRTGAWSAWSNDLNQWLQVNFQRLTLIAGISTQGRVDHYQFVRSYTISFSKTGGYFMYYTEGKKPNVY